MGVVKIVDSMIANEEIARLLTDKELCEELRERIWAKLDISSWESALIVQAITRLNED